MKFIGLLSWFDEPVEWLARCAASMSHCETLICLDGAYRLFESGRDVSPEEQYAALSGAHPNVVFGDRCGWASQTQKRTRLFELAYEHGTPFEDWVHVIDADEWVLPWSDFERLKSAVYNNPTETVLVAQHTDPIPDMQRIQPLLRSDYVGRSGPQPRIFQLMDRMYCGPTHHWHYGGFDRLGAEVSLKGWALGMHRRPRIFDASGIVGQKHDTLNRSQARLEAKMRYYDLRQVKGEDL